MLLDEHEDFPEPKLAKSSKNTSNVPLLGHNESVILKKISQENEKGNINVKNKLLEKKDLSKNNTAEEFSEYDDNNINQESSQINKSSLDNGNLSAKLSQDKGDAKLDVNQSMLLVEAKSNKSIKGAAEGAQQANQSKNMIHINQSNVSLISSSNEEMSQIATANQAPENVVNAQSADSEAKNEVVAEHAINETVANINVTGAVAKDINLAKSILVPGSNLEANQTENSISNKKAGPIAKQGLLGNKIDHPVAKEANLAGQEADADASHTGDVVKRAALDDVKASVKHQVANKGATDSKVITAVKREAALVANRATSNQAISDIKKKVPNSGGKALASESQAKFVNDQKLGQNDVGVSARAAWKNVENSVNTKTKVNKIAPRSPEVTINSLKKEPSKMNEKGEDQNLIIMNKSNNNDNSSQSKKKKKKKGLDADIKKHIIKKSKHVY
jgi:hypothetical protein